MKKKNAGHYARPQIRLNDEEIMKQSGRCRTVDIVVLSRRRAGWQGIIIGQGEIPAREFQSEMDLLKYLDMEIRK